MTALYLLILSIITVLTSYIIIYVNRYFGNKYIDNIKGVQKFHTKPTPRLGGLALYITFIFNTILTNEYQELWIMIMLSSVPVFLSGFLEDLFGNISPKYRLLAAFLSGLSFVLLTGFYVKNVNFLFFDNLLSIYFVSLIFTSLAISGVSNSINIIDGFHGLASGTLIIMFFTFAVIGWYIEDHLVVHLAIISIFVFIGFFIINFPFGHIFLGDAGAYFGGFLLSIIAIILPFRNPEISSWVSFLICLYPIIETLFSMIRKIIRKGHHPSKPDSVHLHMLIYRGLARKISKTFGLESYRNAITSIIVLFFPLATCIMAITFYDVLSLIVASIVIMISTYYLIYKKISLNW